MPTLGTNVIVLKDEGILLTLRNDVPMWCLPGGGIDAGESVAQCAVREVFEETGLHVELIQMVGVYSRPLWGLDGDHVVVFTAVPVAGELAPSESEVRDIGYFAMDDLPETTFWWHKQRIEDAGNGRRGITATQNVPWPFGNMSRAEFHKKRQNGDLPDNPKALIKSMSTPPTEDALQYEVNRKNTTTENAKSLAFWSNQILELAGLGLHFEKENVYAQERYRKLQTIGMEMLALADGVDVAELEPLRSTVLSRPTPFTVADCAVFDDNGRLALIKRADNSLWAMPGGALEVGETAAAGSAREFHEETGMVCEVTGLAGVFDNWLWGSNSRHHSYQFVFMGKLIDGDDMGNGSHKHEVLDVAWFAEDELPRGEMDPNHVGRVPMVFDVWQGEKRPFFDNSQPCE